MKNLEELEEKGVIIRVGFTGRILLNLSGEEFKNKLFKFVGGNLARKSKDYLLIQLLMLLDTDIGVEIDSLKKAIDLARKGGK